MASSHYHKKLENGLESTRHELFLSMNSFDGRTLEGRLDPRSRFCPRDDEDETKRHLSEKNVSISQELGGKPARLNFEPPPKTRFSKNPNLRNVFFLGFEARLS